MGNYKNNDWQKIATHDEKNVKGFFGDYRYLSNFHVADVWYEGLLYPSSENAYQAAKVLPEYRKNFVDISPAKSKLEWKKSEYEKVDWTADEWDARKYDVMMGLVFQKFLRHKDLKEKLLGTGNKYLEETNWWNDVYYGIDCKTGRGQNILGHILMNIRNFWKNSNKLVGRLSVNGIYDQNIPNYK